MRGRVVGRLAALLVALTLGACPPPPDPGGDGTSTESPADPVTPTGGDPVPRDPDPVTGGGGVEAPPPEAGETEVAQGNAKPVKVAYEKLRGGVFVPHCPRCGEVQPEGSRKCGGCSQALTPWMQDTLCSACAGHGDCGRCGDDRECLACDADGRCAYCDGTGTRPEGKCVECGGGGKCASCRGDGWRERHSKDFLPGDAALPGVCPTCVDGSGICPQCGSTGQDSAGEVCLSCAGTNLCHDCGGSGACVHDGGDGLCVVCGGGGREVVNGPARPVRERIWNLRTKAGTVVTGRVPVKPSPNVHVMVKGTNGRETKRGQIKSDIDPLSYYRISRSWVETAQGHLNLSVFAQQERLWPLARNELRLAAELDDGLRDAAEADLRELPSRRAEDWLERAAAADRSGDADHALLLLRMVEFELPGDGAATRAKASAARILRRLEAEESGLDDAARAAARESSRERVGRTVERARLRIERARTLLGELDRRKMPDTAQERTYRRADRAAWSAARLVLAEARRETHSGGLWPENPAGLVVEARKLRGLIAATYAARQTAGARFGYAVRLAQRALTLDGTNPLASQILIEARIGLARRGVERGSPPPRKDD